MKKILSRLLIILIVVAAVLALGKNFFAKIAVEKGVKAATGLPLKIDKFDIGISNTQVGINGLSLMNPEGFPNEAMFHAPEIFVNYNLGSIIRGNIHLEEVRLDFDQFVVVKNARGKTNLEALKDMGGPAGKDAKEDKKTAAPEFQIDRLSLKVGKLVYKDYSRGGEPSVKEYKINLAEEMTNVTSAQAILGHIATKALAMTALNSLVDFNTDMIIDATNVPGQVVGQLKNTADALKSKINLPFGK